jgi:hydrogenase-4 membrane subunit HyfE
MHLHIKLIGILLIALALVHIVFPKYFNWRKELSSLSLINRQMMTVHTLFIALTVFLMGLLCLTSSRELIETNIGNKISLGLGIFWTLRLLIQFFGYSSELWRGKKFETIMHIVFSLLWAYLSIIFFTIYFT